AAGGAARKRGRRGCATYRPTALEDPTSHAPPPPDGPPRSRGPPRAPRHRTYVQEPTGAALPLQSHQCYLRPSLQISASSDLSMANETQRSQLGSAGLNQDFLGDVEVRVYGLDVVELFQRLHQPEDRLGPLTVEGHAGLWQPGQLGGGDLHPGGLQGLAHRAERLGRGDHLPLFPRIPTVVR